jgi:hypothetical protein
MTNKKAIKKLQSIRLHSLYFSNEEAEEIHKALLLAMISLDRFDGAVEVAWVAGNIMSDGGIKLKEKPFQFINTSIHKLYAIPRESKK